MDASDTFRDRSDTAQLESSGRSDSGRNGSRTSRAGRPAGRVDVGLENHAVTQQDNAVTQRRDDDGGAGANDSQTNGRLSGLLNELYGPIIGSLAKVEATLQSELQSPFEGVSALLRHGVQLGGKRLRPAIHLLMADALGGIGPNNIIIGAVLEMVHTATLVHDDVLDEASTRRHVPTINAQWNDHTSILLGDYLFAQSFRLAATLDSTRTCQWVGEAARLVCEGELRQVLARDDVEIDRDTYFDIIRGKTAELCRVACSLAAGEASRDADAIDQLADYGNCLGIAFQIADDFLDLWGDDQTVGKTVGTDLQQGKMTLPIIRLLETADPAARLEILGILKGPADDRMTRLGEWLEQSDAKEFTFRTASSFKDRALAALIDLPPSDAKNCLINIAEFSIQRSF
ncbi:MAG: polyprenyl synthetase family protein [Planctomycetales bacterium]|nr:polyprenyl synthetase family protein [Planctomycetales bacterium]